MRISRYFRLVFVKFLIIFFVFRILFEADRESAGRMLSSPPNVQLCSTLTRHVKLALEISPLFTYLLMILFIRLLVLFSVSFLNYPFIFHRDL